MIASLHSVTDPSDNAEMEHGAFDEQHWIEEFSEPGMVDLPHELVTQAKREEMLRFERMKVYEVVPKSDADREGLAVVLGAGGDRCRQGEVGGAGVRR